jgi:hypothetical protein
MTRNENNGAINFNDCIYFPQPGKNELAADQTRTATETTTNAAATITSHTTGVNLLADILKRPGKWNVSYALFFAMDDFYRHLWRSMAEVSVFSPENFAQLLLSVSNAAPGRILDSRQSYAAGGVKAKGT